MDAFRRQFSAVCCIDATIVRGTRLGPRGWTISEIVYGGRVDEEVAHPHPSQTRMCRFPASGSSWESLATLNHTIPGMAGVYRRHNFVEEKKAALEGLATLVLDIVGPTSD